MANFSFTPLDLEDSFLIEAFSTGDARGGFTKWFEQDIFRDAGIDFHVNETFTSISSYGVLRGMHFQTHNPQAKLVSVPVGRIYDVIVDLRPQSKTFKQWRGFELSAENHLTLYVPRGFAHGFLSLEDHTMVLYHCDGPYDRATDTGIRFDDPDIGINWPDCSRDTIHSARDLALMSFKEYQNNPMCL